MVINLPNYERQTTILNNTQTIINGLNNAGGKTPTRRVFINNGTWVAPVGVTKVFITGGGGGGGGAAYVDINNKANGSAGGNTSFGTLLTLTGGGGGVTGTGAEAFGGSPGGKGGQPGGSQLTSGSVNLKAGDGGNSGFYFGGVAVSGSPVIPPANILNGGACSGGAGVFLGTGAAGGGGGAEFVINQPLNVTAGTTYTITIGNGGNGGSTSTAKGGNGGKGILTIEWWE